MKKYILVSAGLLLSGIFIASCTSDLNLKPVSQISVASFWSSQDDAKAATYGMYVDLRAETENGNLFFLGEARSEALESSFATGPRKYWENSLSASDPGPSWINLYKIVHDANLLLKYVPNISMPEPVKNNILAQAYSMRAFTYFILVKSWGEVPLLTEPTEAVDPGSVQKEAGTREAIFTRIKSDIDEAFRLFPDAKFPAGRNTWSKPALLALKADVYLWSAKKMDGGNPDLQTSLDALNEFQHMDVELLSDYSSVFDYANKGNKEIILAIQFQHLQSGQNWGSRSYMHPGYISPYFDTATLAGIGAMSGSPDCTISTQVRKQFSAHDQRGNATFYEMYITNPETRERTFYGSFSTKYNGFVQNGIRYFVDDIILYRYADILLMKAEAKNALGMDPAEEINQIRKRAYGSSYQQYLFTAGTRDENDNAILKERLLEFTFEGKRWWDLLRFNKAFEMVPSLKSKEGNTGFLLFPIPESVLSLNSKLKQVEGY